MASKKDIDTAIETLLWSSRNAPKDDYVEDHHTANDLSDSARAAIAGLVDAIDETRPRDLNFYASGYDRAIHRGVLDVCGDGVGLWDDDGETWEGHGKAWSKRLRADPRVKGFSDAEGLYVGDDGKIYVCGRETDVIDTIDGTVSTVRVHPHKPRRALPTDAVGFSQYGAFMGRRATSLSSTRQRCRLFLVPLDSGGYDRGGAYWGTGRNRRSDLYCLVDDDGDAIAYVRAGDRKQAAVKLSTDHVFRLARS